MSDSTDKATDSAESADKTTGEALPPESAGESAPETAEAIAAKTEDAPPEPADELEKALADLEESHNKYLRLAAESENLRKRTVREVEQARKYAIERFAGELLAVVDSLEMGIDAGEQASAEALLEGSEATLKLLLNAFGKTGLEQLNPVGEPFDPNLHEAMTMQPSDSAEPGSVLAVVQKGYQLNGRLLRPARVIVATEPASASSD